MGAAGGYNQGTALARVSQGDLLVGGHFGGTEDFDPNGGISNVSALGTYDMFLLKLSSAGNFMWIKNVGGTNSIVFVKDIEVDANSQIVLTGSYTATVDFDPRPNQYQLINARTFI